MTLDEILAAIPEETGIISREEMRNAIIGSHTYALALAAYFSGLINGGMPLDEAVLMTRAREERDSNGARINALFQTPAS